MSVMDNPEDIPGDALSRCGDYVSIDWENRFPDHCYICHVANEDDEGDTSACGPHCTTSGPRSSRHRATITDDEAERLLFCVRWLGPWERLQGFFYGVRQDNTLRWETPADPRGLLMILGSLGDFCNRRDIAWRARHVARGTRPWGIWMRRPVAAPGKGRG